MNKSKPASENLFNTVRLYQQGGRVFFVPWGQLPKLPLALVREKSPFWCFCERYFQTELKVRALGVELAEKFLCWIMCRYLKCLEISILSKCE